MANKENQGNTMSVEDQVKPLIVRATHADMEAYFILRDAGLIPLTTEEFGFTKAGNIIIELAEKIKAERSVVAMHV